MDWCCCRVSSNVQRSSRVIDMNYTGSHACSPHTRNIVGPVDLINLNSELWRSDVGTVHTGKLKEENRQHMTAKFLRTKKKKKKPHSTLSLSRYESHKE